MLEAVVTFGVIIVLGFAFIAAKLPRGVLLWLLGHDILVDLAVTAVTLWIHWGTMTGLMAAALAGMICSLMTTFGRKLYGFTRRGVTVPPQWRWQR